MLPAPPTGLRPSLAVAPVTDLPPWRVSTMQRIGFLALWIFVFSLAGSINETSYVLLGGAKPYSTTIAGPVMAICLLISGNMFRGLRTKSGMLWLTMLVLITAGLPFSVWRSDSLALWLQYILKIYPLFFFICAGAVTVAYCEKLIYALVLAGSVLVVLVALLGDSSDGRLIMGKGTFSNPNSLALQLILVACSFIYLIYRGGRVFPIVGVIGIAICALFVFKTGSRGAFLGAICAVVGIYFAIRKPATRLKMLAVVAVLGVSAVGAALTSATAFKRLTDIALSDRMTSDSPDELYAGASQTAREELARLAIELSLTHPLLGVGMGEFPVAIDVSLRGQGRKSSWNGTHNTYLQVSSECGIPAAICYILVLSISIRTAFGLHREFSLRPGKEKIAGMALTLFAALVSLSVALFFFHEAYSYYVPVFCGLTIALSGAADGHRETAR